MLRIFRSPKADFERDAELAHEVYTEDELKAIADHGFNAVWVRVVFRQLLKHPDFPEFGEHSDAWIDNLRRVIDRGEKCGVRLVAYCQEPFGLAVDDPFWETHPDLAGAPYPHNFGSAEQPFRMRALCTSAEPVRRFIADSAARLAERLPGLAAVLTITASEFISHCYSHYATTRVRYIEGGQPPLDCPRCSQRPPTDIVAEILNALREGMDRVDKELPLIAWNWSWKMYEEDPQPTILENIDPRIQILADFERGGNRTDPNGVDIFFDEYSLAYVGPSERFMGIHDLARKQGRAVLAKLQLGTTHEIATVVNMPLVDRLFGKADAIRRLGLEGFMGCWNFGNVRSVNTKAFNFFLSPDAPDDAEPALRAVARTAFPGGDPDAILEAWKAFGHAFDFYPFSNGFLYASPLNYALALPITPAPYHEKAIGRSWLMDPRDDNDDPERLFGLYPPEDVLARFESMVEHWNRGLEAYERGLAGAGGDAAVELDNARAIGLSLRSARNYFRLYPLKRDWSDGHMDDFREIVRDEIEAVDAAIPIYERNPDLGFHIEGHGYMVSADLMREKRTKLEKHLA